MSKAQSSLGQESQGSGPDVPISRSCARGRRAAGAHGCPCLQGYRRGSGKEGGCSEKEVEGKKKPLLSHNLTLGTLFLERKDSLDFLVSDFGVNFSFLSILDGRNFVKQLCFFIFFLFFLSFSSSFFIIIITD